MPVPALTPRRQTQMPSQILIFSQISSTRSSSAGEVTITIDQQGGEGDREQGHEPAARGPGCRGGSRPWRRPAFSPIRRRVRKVEDIPSRSLSRNSIRLKWAPTLTISAGALLVGEQHRHVLARARRGDDGVLEPEARAAARAPAPRPSG